LRVVDKKRVRRGTVLQKTRAGHGRVERRERAVAEIRALLAGLYRSFVAWASLYGDVDDRDERDRRERVSRLSRELSNGYLARSMWLEEGTRRKIEAFIEKSENLYSEVCADVEEQGYARTRAGMAYRVSRKLGPLKREIESDLETEPEPNPRRRPRR
jgi:hypothetical protein